MDLEAVDAVSLAGLMALVRLVSVELGASHTDVVIDGSGEAAGDGAPGERVPV